MWLEVTSMSDTQNTPLIELRQQWETAWGRAAHHRLGRVMLEKSLYYKQAGLSLTEAEKLQLQRLVQRYKRNPHCFDDGAAQERSAGVRLVRKWKGEEHEVVITQTGFMYRNTTFSSLSAIATHITGTRWNGRVFFGLKSQKDSAASKAVSDEC